MPDKKQKILTVDDHPLIHQGLQRLIEQELDLEICGSAVNSQEAIHKISQCKPDLVILDISLGGTDGIELLKIIRIHNADLPVLIHSVHDEALYAERALRAGASGYVMKDEASDKLLLAIREILNGEIYLSSKMTKFTMRRHYSGQPTASGSMVDSLSDRELVIFRLVGSGYSIPRIAKELNLGAKTVETHCRRIKKKLGCRDTHEFVWQSFQFIADESRGIE